MTQAASEPAAPAALTPANRLLLIVVMLGCYLASAESSQLNIAIDALSSLYSVSLALANWVTLVFAIVAGSTIACATALLKRYGLRPLLLVCYSCSLVGSIVGLIAPNFACLIVARVLQALTAGIVYPTATTVIVAVVPLDKQGVVIAVESAINGAAMAISPLVSGLIVTYLGVRWSFVPPVLIAVLVLVLGRKWLHDVVPREHRWVDGRSMALALIGFSCFILGLNSVTEHTLPAVIAMAVGVAVIALFARRQTRIAHPLLRLSPFKVPRFIIGEAACELGNMSTVFLMLLVPLYLEGTCGWTPFGAGLLLAAPIVAYSFVCILGGRIEDKHGLWPLAPVAFGLLAAGLLVLWFATRDKLVGLLLVAAIVADVGIGLFFPTFKAHDMDSLPEKIAPYGASLHSVFGQVVNSVSSALFVGVMSGVEAAHRAAGASKAAAYGAGFDTALMIDLGIVAVALVVGVAFAWKTRKPAAE